MMGRESKKTPLEEKSAIELREFLVKVIFL